MKKRIISYLSPGQLTTQQYLLETLGKEYNAQIKDAFIFGNNKKIEELLKIAETQLTLSHNIEQF